MEEFFTNISRYPRYLITFSLGVLFTLFSPLVPLFKRPTTAIAAISLLVAALVCLSFTLRAMLGLEVAPLWAGTILAGTILDCTILDFGLWQQIAELRG